MRNTLKITLMCIAAILLQVALAHSSGTWKIGHVRSAGSVVDLDVQKFIKNIEKNSQGNIRFDIYAANKLGDYSVVQERVSFGEVEMYLGPFGTGVDKKLSLAFTPFLVTNWTEARRMYSSSSPLIKHMDSFLQAQNIKILGGYPVYFGGIALTEKPNQPTNPDVSKGIIIRVPPMRSFERTARELGYTPYPITWMYARMGLKTGMVGGLIGGGAEGYLGLPNIRYYVPLKDHFEYWFVYMNLDLWKSLSAENQQIISRAAAEMEEERYSKAEQFEIKSLAELKKIGIEVIEMNNAEYEQTRKKIQEKVWPVMKEDIGPAFDEVVRFAESDQ